MTKNSHGWIIPLIGLQPVVFDNREGVDEMGAEVWIDVARCEPAHTRSVLSPVGVVAHSQQICNSYFSRNVT